MKKTTYLLVCCSISFLSVIIGCSLPDEIEPVKWNMHLEVPIIDEHLTIGDVVTDSSLAGLAVDFGDTMATSDTVGVTKTDSLEYTIEKILGSTDTSVIAETFGPQPLRNTPLVDIVFGLGDELPENAIPDVPLPAAVPLSQSKDSPLRGIKHVLVDESSPMLPVTVTNLSSGAALENVNIHLLNGSDTIGTFFLPVLHALASNVVPVKIGGRSIGSSITVVAVITISAGSVVSPEDGLRVSFTLDEQMIAEALISDSCINYSEVLDGTLNVADSLRIDAIDIDEALLSCEVTNPTLMKVKIDGTLHEAWALDYSEKHNLVHARLLVSGVDSSAFAGNIISDTLFRTANPFSEMTVPIRSMRVFPSWNPDSLKSFVRYGFKIRALPDGRMVSFRKNDQFIVRLIRHEFPFIRISGKFIGGTEHTFSTNTRVGFDWKSSITDSLKNSLLFESVRIHLDLVSELPTGSSIDSLLVQIGVKNPDVKEDTSVVVKKYLTGIKPGSHHAAEIDVTDLLNEWPDSIAFHTRLFIPSGSMVTLYNSRNDQGGLASTLSIDMKLHWSVSMPFSWRIADTVRTELDSSAFSLKTGELDWLKDLEDPRIRIAIAADNRTNLHFILHGIGAAGKYSDELAAFPDSLIGTVGWKERTGDRLFSLFDNDGLRLAPRGEATQEFLQLDSRGVDALLSEDKCCIRWFLIIPAGGTDALLTSDYLDLKVTGIIEGVGNSDSILDSE